MKAKWNELTEEEEVIANFMDKNNIQLSDVIDVVIKANGVIGVGIYTLASGLYDYTIDWQTSYSDKNKYGKV